VLDLSTFNSKTAVAAVRFENVGDNAHGVIVGEPELVDDAHNPGGRPVLVVTLDSGKGEPQKLWARSAQMLEQIASAVQTAGVQGIEAGGELTVIYREDRTLRSGRVMKVYGAEYQPPARAGGANNVADEAGVEW
jgi:hypothetical protein